jgi:asparagine synthase (glutamine-hydrolysing)
MVTMNGEKVSRENLGRMDAALAHHGSEGGGVWHAGIAGMGQRLRCFTPQDAFERQPLASPGGSLILISDARIDNREELLAELFDKHKGSIQPFLKNPGGTSDIPDSALILRAYETWGEACITKIVGVFAFALWNEGTKTLFAARSPISAPTLMYSLSSKVFAFATSPNGLHALPFIPRELNEERLSDLLVQMRGGPKEATLYRHISRLPTGWCLSVGQNGMKTRGYWQPDLNREIRFSCDDDYQEAFLHLFRRVVSDHLCSTTKVSIQLSGGLDSSSVAAMAARILDDCGERLTAFTEVPIQGFSGSLSSGRYADETPFVQAIAAMHENLDLNLMPTTGQMFLDGLDCLFHHLEAPFRNSSNRVWIEAIFRETSARGMKVLLDGMQGNLTMSWNGSGLLPGLISKGKWRHAFREASACVQNKSIMLALSAWVGQGFLPLMPDSLWTVVDRLRHPDEHIKKPWLTYFPIHPDFAKAQRLSDRARERKHATRYRPTSDTRLMRFEALSNQDLGTYLCAYRSMFGVDRRTPPADVRLAEFCLALPEDQCLRNGESRRFLRRTMAHYLPTMVLNNRRRGLQSADWFERLNCARDKVAADLLRLEKSELARQTLDLKRMRHLFDHMPTHAAHHDSTIMTYYWIVQHGLMTGRFLRWFEEGNVKSDIT